MRLRNTLHCLLALGLGGLLGACSYLGLETKRVDYKSASRLPPLEIPPDLTRPTADDRYAVPDIGPRGQATYSEYSRERSGPRPAATVATVLPKQDNVRIERDGNQRWLVVKGTPDQVWPVVKEFWQETGFIVNVEIPEAGVMETDWAESRATNLPNTGWLRSFLGKIMDMPYSSSERDKFRTRLERGTEPGTTEIFISHRGMEEVFVSSGQERTMWQPRPPDPNLESMMLGRLMTRFGVEESRARAQLASAKALPPRAALSKSTDGARTLALEDQFDRAWRRVGLALDRVGFTVEDRDRSKGLYFVRYIDPQLDGGKAAEKGRGWFSWMRFWGDSKPKPMEQYRIEVKDLAQGSQVAIYTRDGARDNSETAGRILTLLYEQLK
jgi:outer membrane protein assembly factor BamC